VLLRAYVATGFVPPALLSRPACDVDAFLQMAATYNETMTLKRGG
jgi:hypothetical protein